MLNTYGHPRSGIVFVRMIASLSLLLMVSVYSSEINAHDCTVTNFWECSYDHLVDAYDDLEDYYTETVVPGLKATIEDLETQLGAPVRIAEDLAEVVDRDLLDVLGLNTDMLARLNEAVSFINGQNDVLLDEYEAFAANKECTGICADFRFRLSQLLRQATHVTNRGNQVLLLQQKLNGGAASLWLPPEVNADRLVHFIDNAPPSLLFPLYYALNSTPAGQQGSFAHTFTGDSGCAAEYCTLFTPLNEIFSTLETQLDGLESLLNRLATTPGIEMANAPYASIEFIPSARSLLCRSLFINPDVPNEMAKYTAYIGVAAKVLNKIGDFFAKAKVTVVEGETSVGLSFGADIQLSVKRRPMAKLGAGVRMVTGPLRMIAEGLSNKVADCRQRLEQHLALCAISSDIKKNMTFAKCKERVIDDGIAYGF